MDLEKIKALALSKNLTIGTVESITGGLIAAALTSIPGASSFFKGSLITYKNAIKIAVAKVDEKLIRQHGSISKEVSLEMAKNGKDILAVDVCIAITGNAGPNPIEDKPVGEVYITVFSPQLTKQEYFLMAGSREEIRIQSVEQALIMLEKLLLVL